VAITALCRTLMCVEFRLPIVNIPLSHRSETMVTKVMGSFSGGSFVTDKLDPFQVDTYNVSLTEGVTYSFQDVASDLPLRFSLAAADGTIVNTATLQGGEITSYTPAASGDYTLSVGGGHSPNEYWLSGGDAQVARTNVTTGVSSNPFMGPYTGPVDGLTEQFIDITPDSLNIVATTPNVFLRSGSGMDGLTVTSGDNVLDGSTGSNFLIGGIGHDTFYMDDRNPVAPIFSTIVNFHQGDNATVWGVNASDFTMIVMDNQGAEGAKGLDLLFSKAGQPDVSFVLAGYSSADLTNGRLSLSYGHTGDWHGNAGSDYLTVHANA
jgi:Ca2+-binding RTX toxin-like protein